MEPRLKISTDAFLSRFSSDEKRIKLIASLLLIGILLIFAGGTKSDTLKTEKDDIDTSGKFVSESEARLEEILSSVDGVGRTKVLITLESGRQSVYAVNEKQSDEAVSTYANGEISRSEKTGDIEQSYLLIDTGSGKAPLEITSSEPTIRGVLVVCEGAASSVTKKNVLDAVTTALGIGSDRVCILEYKS